MNRDQAIKTIEHLVFCVCALSLSLLLPGCYQAEVAEPAGPPLPPTPASPAIRVALLTPSTGEMATFGRMARNGSIMALEEWNSRGGLLQHHFEWVLYNSGCSFETGGQAAGQAIDDGVDFIIGPLCSDAAIAAAQVAAAHQALMISPTATHPLVTVTSQGQTRPTVFRAAYAYPLQARAAARFAYDRLKVNKAALVFDPADDYSASLAETFAQQFSTQGGEIVYRAVYATGDTDFSEILTAVSSAGARMIYLPAAYNTANRVAGQLREMTLSNPAAALASLILLGSDSWQSDNLDLTAAEGSYFTVHFALDEERPAVQAWAEAYRATYAVEPNTLAALGYDATLILATAIEQAGAFETSRVAAALERETVSGVTGQINFDRQHNPVKPVPIVQIKDQRLVFFDSVRP